MGIGDWDWGLGPIPNPQSPIYYKKLIIINIIHIIIFKFYLKY